MIVFKQSLLTCLHISSRIIGSHRAAYKKWSAEAKASGLSGDILHFSSIFGTHTIVMKDPDSVKQALTSPEVFLKNHPLLRYLIGDGLFVMPYSEDWKRHRRIIQPCFQKRGIKDSMETIARTRKC